jgi:hypothetical protein
MGWGAGSAVAVASPRMNRRRLVLYAGGVALVAAAYSVLGVGRLLVVDQAPDELEDASGNAADEEATGHAERVNSSFTPP